MRDQTRHTLCYGLDRLREYFGFDVLGTEEAKTSSVDEILKWIFILAKKRLIEKDLETFQRDAYVVNSRLYEIAYGLIPATATPYERDFMKKTIPVMINWNSPNDTLYQRESSP